MKIRVNLEPTRDPRKGGVIEKNNYISESNMLYKILAVAILAFIANRVLKNMDEN